MPRLLLVAMSGVRIVNPELQKLGMTLPGFIERGKAIASMPSLGLLTIAGATPTSWDITYVEAGPINEETLRDLAQHQPDFVAVSSLSARVHDAYRALDFFREQGVKTAIGGLHASVLPNEAGAHADVVITGQGEWLWPSLLEDFERGEMQSLYNGMHVKTELDTSPIPRFDLLDTTQYNRIPIQTTRGCPLDCAFCAASRLISPYKRKSISRIRQELECVLDIWPKPFVELADDNTFVNKSWARELAELMCEYPQVKWFTETDISLANDEKLIELLAESGCAQVLIGLESVSTESLEDTDTKHWKKRQRQDYRDKIRRIQSGGISVNGCFVFGFDSDTSDTFARTWDFVQESELSEIQITLLTPFPGTSLYAQLRDEGRLLKETFWDQCTLFDVTFTPRNFTPHQLETEFQNLVATVYSDKANRARASIRTSIYRSRTTQHEAN
jgi:radical SAM superfamily enzyme YgiQ (UPF0313 family)